MTKRAALEAGDTDRNAEISGGGEDGLVRGERGWPAVARTRSLRSRVSSIMAFTLMVALGVGMLTWYYSNALSRQTRARHAERANVASRIQGEVALPALGRIEPPLVPPPPRGNDRSKAPDDIAAERAQALLPPPIAPRPLLQTQQIEGGTSPGAAQYGSPPAKTPAQLAFERRTSGAAFARTSDPNSISGNAETTASPVMQMTQVAGGSAVAGASPRYGAELTALLQPSAFAPARAEVLPTKRFLLPKGAFIDCTLETAIDSTLPGMTTCVTATDTFGVDGEVVLLERGTKLIGETRGQVQQGAARVFVLWTSARTPSGVVVPLDSPAADELGRAGLAGDVDHHFWQRFGAAILISMLDGAVQGAVQSTARGSGPVIYSPGPSAGIVTEVLKSTVNIAPTITKRNGERIQVLVARDVDFRSVYELRSTATGE